MSYNRGTYQRSHTRQASSVSGFSVLPELSVKDTLILHSRFVQQGLLDAFKVKHVIDSLGQNKIVQGNIVKSSLLLLVVLFSALIIKPLLGSVIPSDHSSSQRTGGIFFVLFHILWLWPLACAAVYYSGILNAPEPLDRDRRGQTGRNDRGLTANLVIQSYKALVLANYLLVVFVLRYIPLIGGPLAFLYASVVDSYYCFEAQWIKQGWPLDERIKHLESRWAYFIGFGMPITMLSWWSSDPVVNLTLFSLFFPIFQIMTPSSLPQPLDPKLPTSSMSISSFPQGSQGSFSMAAAEGGEEARGRKGNAMVPVRIRCLGGADAIYKILTQAFVSGKARKKDANGPLPPLPPSNIYDPTNGAGAGWRNDYGGGAPSVPTSTTSGGRFGHGGSSFNSTPPRRGHAATESSIGVGYGGYAVGGNSAYAGGAAPGGEFQDKKLDSLINAAGRRKKGE